MCIVSTSDPFFDLVGLVPAAASHLAAKGCTHSFLRANRQTVAVSSGVAAKAARQLHKWFQSRRKGLQVQEVVTLPEEDADSFEDYRVLEFLRITNEELWERRDSRPSIDGGNQDS